MATIITSSALNRNDCLDTPKSNRGQEHAPIMNTTWAKKEF